MIPSILEQVLAAKQKPLYVISRMDDRIERIERTAELLLDRNHTAQTMGDALGCHFSKAAEYLKDLCQQRRATRWRVKSTYWYAVTQAELSRRKRH